MGSRPVLVLGNIASMVLTMVAFLQLLSWTITGLLILATLTLSTLAPGRGSGARPPSRKSMVQAASAEMKQRERTIEKTIAHSHPRPDRIQSKPTGREAVRPVDSQPTPQREGAISANTSRSGSARQESLKTLPPRIVPPKTVPSTFSPSKQVPTKLGLPMQEPSRPVTPSVKPPSKPPLAKQDSGRNPTIGRGDYQSSEVVLDGGEEVTCTVTSSGRVNVYLLDEGNLNSLESGEEFWSETGEEDVESAALNFTAPEKGKWFLVVENADLRDVSATVKIEKSASKTGQAIGSNAERQVKSGLG